MSKTEYILIYPFDTRERAFEIANDIDGQLMWFDGKTYPTDDVAAEIITLDEYKQIQSLIAQNNRYREALLEIEKHGDKASSHIATQALNQEALDDN